MRESTSPSDCVQSLHSWSLDPAKHEAAEEPVMDTTMSWLRSGLLWAQCPAPRSTAASCPGTLTHRHASLAIHVSSLKGTFDCVTQALHAARSSTQPQMAGYQQVGQRMSVSLHAAGRFGCHQNGCIVIKCHPTCHEVLGPLQAPSAARWASWPGAQALAGPDARKYLPFSYMSLHEGMGNYIPQLYLLHDEVTLARSLFAVRFSRIL